LGKADVDEEKVWPVGHDPLEVRKTALTTEWGFYGCSKKAAPEGGEVLSASSNPYVENGFGSQGHVRALGNNEVKNERRSGRAKNVARSRKEIMNTPKQPRGDGAPE